MAIAEAGLMNIRRTKAPLLVRELGDVVRYWDVFSSLVTRDFKGRYRAKILGIFWSIGDPLVMMFVYTLVFTYVFKNRIYAYPVVLLLALCPHRFFANGVVGATNSITDYSPLVKRVAFPRHLLPLAVIASHLIHFSIELLLVGAVGLFYPGSLRFSTALGWLPVVFGVQLTYMVGLAFFASALNVWFRDMQYLLNSLILILYWLTPIIYPISFVPDWLLPYYRLNPMAGVVVGYRRILMESLPPDGPFLAVGAAVAVAFLVIGVTVFRRCEGTFADYV
jgi:lipopolysaccharide transport system permease protein